jgi:hypothetical protein
MFKSDHDIIAKLVEAREHHRLLLSEAVVNILLPSLPSELHDISALGEDITANKLFAAIDAVAMAVYNVVEFDCLDKQIPFYFKNDSFIWHNEKVVLVRDVIIEEIHHVANVHHSSAMKLANWIRLAARNNKKLFLGIDSSPIDETNVMLILTDSSREENLATRWQQGF